MLEFYHNLEVPENINPIQCTLLTDFDGEVHICSYPEGLIDKFVFVTGGKIFFYCDHTGPGGWNIIASHGTEEARMNLVVFAIPAEMEEEVIE